jgi:hypothetical protein
MTAPGYDAKILATPYDEPTIGTEEGETCDRYEEPDEDAPRGYKPKPCKGTMVLADGVLICDTCGETVE